MDGETSVQVKLDDSSMIRLRQAQFAIRRIVGRSDLPSNADVIEWMLAATPWDELVRQAEVSEKERC